MSTLTQMHAVTVNVRKDVVSTLGSMQTQTIIHGFDVGCDCGWVAFYPTLAEANEACGLHSAGLDPTPTPPEEVERQAEGRRRAAADEFERVRARMLETGDPFCE